MIIRLIGPGAAGKTTVGRALAQHLHIGFIDLDEHFGAGVGDISAYLRAHGYSAYANRNLELYSETLATPLDAIVFALSSGFMTYADDAHPDYPRIRAELLANPTTLVLLPSLDEETCVAETVRRQLARSFARSADEEEQVIRDRFALYRDLPNAKFETAKPINLVVDEIAIYLSSNLIRVTLR